MDDTTVGKKSENNQLEAVVSLTNYDVVIAAGEDAVSYLQGQLSQDVAAIAIGQTAPSLLLQPQGKLVAWLRVHRSAADAFWLVADAGFGTAVLERLQQFKLRVKVDLSVETLPALAIYGTDEKKVQSLLSERTTPDGRSVASAWPGVFGVDWFSANLTDSGDAASQRLETLRVVAGVAKMGAELDSSTIPAAAGIVEHSVSFTKGCYVGQELVARIDSRGNRTPERLIKIVAREAEAEFSFSENEPEPSQIFVDGKSVGRITSAVFTPNGLEALGYLKRAVETPSDGAIKVSGQEREVAVSLLDLRQGT